MRTRTNLLAAPILLLGGVVYSTSCVSGDIAPRPVDAVRGGTSGTSGSGAEPGAGGEDAGVGGAAGGTGGSSGSGFGGASGAPQAGRSGSAGGAGKAFGPGAGGGPPMTGGAGPFDGGEPATTGGSGGGPSVGGKAGSGGSGPSAPEAPLPLRPWNGEATGSVHAPLAGRPLFTWAPSPNADSYELEVDNSCTIGMASSCEFDSPEVQELDLTEPEFRPDDDLPLALTPPVGRRFYWRVRACNELGCSPWSGVRYADVGRQRKDFDGDGYADVVLGSYYDSTLREEAGAVHIVFGPDFTRSGSTHGAEIYQMLGYTVAFLGDVDADGYADLGVGDDLCIPTGTDRYPCTLASRTFLYRGGQELADGMFTRMLDVGGQEIGALGDFDGDGYADFSLEAGSVVLGGSDWASLEALSPLGEDFQDTSAGADVNGDGFSDFFLRQHGYCGQRATLELYRGAGGGLARTPAETYQTEEDCGGDAEGLAAGDFNGDGHADVVVGSGSTVRLLLGDRSLGLSVEATFPATYFAESGVASGDVNGDGFDDILVSEPGGLYLGAEFISTTPVVSLMPPDEFVSFLGDVNGDGFGDFAYLSPDVGQVLVCHGSESPDDDVDDVVDGFGTRIWQLD